MIDNLFAILKAQRIADLATKGQDVLPEDRSFALKVFQSGVGAGLDPYLVQACKDGLQRLNATQRVDLPDSPAPRVIGSLNQVRRQYHRQGKVLPKKLSE